MRDEDVVTVGAIHGEVFPDSMLTRLGPNVVARYYRWQLADGGVIGLVAVEGGDTVGWLVGGRFSGSMVGFVKRNGLLLTARVLRNPSIVLRGSGRRALQTGARLLLRRSGRRDVERPDRVPPRSFGILAIGVVSRARRHNVGGLLMAEAGRTAAGRGDRRFHLTLNPANAEARSFYEHRGWRRIDVPGDTETAWLMGRELDQVALHRAEP